MTSISSPLKKSVSPMRGIVTAGRPISRRVLRAASRPAAQRRQDRAVRSRSLDPGRQVIGVQACLVIVDMADDDQLVRLRAADKLAHLVADRRQCTDERDACLIRWIGAIEWITLPLFRRR